MPHFTFEPRKELEYLSERMKKFVEEFPDSFSVEFGKEFTPRIEVLHDDATVTVLIELPGVVKEDINLKIKENTLIVSGEKKRPVYEDTKTVHLERNYGTFNREIDLPDEVDRNSIQAKFDSGVLTVTVKKTVPDQSKEINIEIG